MSNRIGTIAPGKAADLLLLDADPLQSLDNVERIHGVMARGEWLPRNVLNEWVEDIRKRNTAR